MEDRRDKNNWFAGLLVTAFVFLALGYAWRFAQESSLYERGYLEAIEEVAVVAGGGGDMQIKIYKYPITSSVQPTSGSMVTMPKGSKMLTVQIQNNQICLWALVDTGEWIKESRTFIIVGTGNDFPECSVTYLGTVQQDCFVWHVFVRDT